MRKSKKASKMECLIPKQRIKFNYFDIDIILVPDMGEYTFTLDKAKCVFPEDWLACCFEGSREMPFGLCFRKGHTDWTVIAHECWHLFFKILRYMGGDQGFHFEVLESEIYAYRFTDLCDSVWSAIKRIEKDIKAR